MNKTPSVIKGLAQVEYKTIMIGEQGCGFSLLDDYWGFCGETDMGQGLPVLCTVCGGSYQRDPTATEPCVTIYRSMEDYNKRGAK